MSIIFTILIAVLCFGLIIFIHELGHFLVAKACKIKVNEFSMGMGPAIFKKKLGETTYSLRAFPIGGYVSMEGEDEESEDNRAFNNKPVYQRLLVVIAGAFMNVVLGFIIICITVSAYYPLIATTKVAKIEENTSFAEKLMVGDEIIAVNNLKVYSMNDVTYEFVRDLDGKVDAIVKRDGKKIEIKDIELRKVANEKGKEIIALDFKVYGKEKTLLSVLGNAGKQTVSTARMVWLSLFDLIRGRYSVSELSGPVGVTTVIGEAASMGFENLLSILSFITINVGVFNLIPFPALDGGRVLFLLVELIIRRPLNRKYEGIINFVGLALLMLLILFVTYNDIVKLFVG